MLAGGAHQALAVAHERAYRKDRGGWPEGGVEQAHAVQVLQPLAVLHITLAAGHVLDVAGVEEADHEAAVLQDLEKRDPIDTGGLHCHGGDGTGFEPVGQGLEILGERAEVAHWMFWVTILGHCRVMDSGPKIDTGGIGVGRPAGRDGFLLSGADALLGHDGAAWLYS